MPVGPDLSRCPTARLFSCSAATRVVRPARTMLGLALWLKGWKAGVIPSVGPADPPHRSAGTVMSLAGLFGSLGCPQGAGLGK